MIIYYFIEEIHESIFETKIINYLLSILVNDDNLPVTYSMYRSIVLSITKIIKKGICVKFLLYVYFSAINILFSDLFLNYFKSNANIRLLYRFCSHFVVTEDKHHIILLKACSIIHACLPKRELLSDNSKCYLFPVPSNRRSGMSSFSLKFFFM